jgi:hypothetical protein
MPETMGQVIVSSPIRKFVEEKHEKVEEQNGKTVFKACMGESEVEIERGPEARETIVDVEENVFSLAH